MYFGGSAERGLHKDVEMSFLGGLREDLPHLICDALDPRSKLCDIIAS